MVISATALSLKQWIWRVQMSSEQHIIHRLRRNREEKTGNYSNNVNYRSRYACCDGVPSMLWVVDDQPTDDE